MQAHNAVVMAQHSTPRSAPAVDGCQECLRESRGDRVMRHVKRTCRSFQAGWESMYDWVFDAATCVRVQSIFFEVTVVFPHKAAHSAFGASLTYLLPCGQGLLLRYSGLLRRIARTLSISVLEDTSKGNTPLLPEVPSVGKTNNICDKENWGHEPGMVAMSCHSTPAFGGVPNSSNILAKPDKSFGVIGDTSSLVKRLSYWNSDLDSIEVERSFPFPVRLSLDNSEDVKLSSQEIEALESSLELSFVFTDLEVSEVTACSPQSLVVSGVFTGLLFFEDLCLRGSLCTDPPR